MSGLIKDSNSLPPSVHASALLPVCLFCLGVFVFNLSYCFFLFFLNHKSSQCLPSLAPPPPKKKVMCDKMFSPQVAPVCMHKLQLHHVLIQYFIFNVAANAHHTATFYSMSQQSLSLHTVTAPPCLDASPPPFVAPSGHHLP